MTHWQSKDAPLVEFMYLVFTRMPGDSYRRRLRSLLFVFVLRISSADQLPGVSILHERSGPRSVSELDIKFITWVCPNYGHHGWLGIH